MLQVGLAIAPPDEFGRYGVTCRDPGGRVHTAPCSTWRDACEFAALLLSEMSKDLLEASRMPPRVNGIIRP